MAGFKIERKNYVRPFAVWNWYRIKSGHWSLGCKAVTVCWSHLWLHGSQCQPFDYKSFQSHCNGWSAICESRLYREQNYLSVLLSWLYHTTLTLSTESPSRQATTHAGPGGPSTSSPTPTDENPPKRRRTDPLLSPVVCYVCQLASLPGKFLPQKAAQLGIPKGPLYGALHRGETVTLPDGTQVSVWKH